MSISWMAGLPDLTVTGVPDPMPVFLSVVWKVKKRFLVKRVLFSSGAGPVHSRSKTPAGTDSHIQFRRADRSPDYKKVRGGHL